MLQAVQKTGRTLTADSPCAVLAGEDAAEGGGWRHQPAGEGQRQPHGAAPRRHGRTHGHRRRSRRHAPQVRGVGGRGGQAGTDPLSSCQETRIQVSLLFDIVIVVVVTIITITIIIIILSLIHI